MQLKFMNVRFVSQVQHDCVSPLKTRIGNHYSKSIILLCVVSDPTDIPPFAVWSCNIVLHVFGVSIGAVICNLESNCTKSNLLFECNLDPRLTVWAWTSTPFAPSCATLIYQVYWVFPTSSSTPSN